MDNNTVSKLKLKNRFEFIPESERKEIYGKILTFNQKEVSEITGFSSKRVAYAIQKGYLKGLTSVKGENGAERFTMNDILEWFELMKKSNDKRTGKINLS